VRGRDRVHDGQAEAASRGLGAVVSGRLPVRLGDPGAAVEPVEGARRVPFGHARPLVADLEHGALAFRVQPDGGGRAGRGVRADVAEQVRQHLPDPRLVGGDHERGWQLGGQVAVRFDGARVGYRVPGEAGQVGFGQVE